MGKNTEEKTATAEQIKMDAAAAEARAELAALDPQAVAAVAAWMASNYLKAGYKRLGRVLVEAAKNGAAPKAEAKTEAPKAKGKAKGKKAAAAA